VAFLVSDASKTVTGQIIGVNSGRVSVWQHPREKNVMLSETPWTLDRISKHFVPFFKRSLEPYGIGTSRYRAPEGE
jgi:hypothetical protein